MKLITHIVTTIMIMILISLFFIGALFYTNTHDILVEQNVRELRSVLQLEKQSINHTIQQHLFLSDSISSRTQLRVSLDSYLREKSIDDEETILRIITDANNALDSVTNMYVTSPTHEFLFGTARYDAAIHANFKPTQRYTLYEKHAYFFSELRHDETMLGYIVIQIPVDLLILQPSGFQYATEELVIGTRNHDGDAIFLTERLFQSETSALDVIPKNRSDVPIIQALNKNETVFLDKVDYRNKPVISVTGHYDDIGLVLKIDKEEALFPLEHLKKVFLLIYAIIIGFVALTLYLISKTISDPLVHLSTVIDRISRGDLKAFIEKENTQDYDEVTVLRRGFERVLASMKLAALRMKRNNKKLYK